MSTGVARRRAFSIRASPTAGSVTALSSVARCAGGCPQDVADLGGLRQWVQLHGGCGVASGACSVLGGFSGHIPCRTVRVQGCDTLQLRSCGTVGEGPGSFDGRAGPGVVGANHFEEKENFLSTLYCEAGYDSQLVHGQLKVAWCIRHPSILPEAERSPRTAHCAG